MTAKLRFIGDISTPYQTTADCPSNIQLEGPACSINIAEPYQHELAGLKKGQYIMVLYWLGDGHTGYSSHQHEPESVPNKQGTFSLRSPIRPNPIGVAVLPIEKLTDGRISVRGLDCLNGTQLIDIKPAILAENHHVDLQH